VVITRKKIIFQVLHGATAGIEPAFFLAKELALGGLNMHTIA